VPGSKVVYLKDPDHKPRGEPVDSASGSGSSRSRTRASSPVCSARFRNIEKQGRGRYETASARGMLRLSGIAATTAKAAVVAGRGAD
jgi:hypothetical protein